MVNINDMKPGVKVHYKPGYGEPENGVVKSINIRNYEAVFVVYHCAGEWDKFNNYTGELTDLKDLHLGWV